MGHISFSIRIETAAAIGCTSPALAAHPILTSEVSTWRIDVAGESLIFVQELRGGRQP
jgi:hypothetical protein